MRSLNCNAADADAECTLAVTLKWEEECFGELAIRRRRRRRRRVAFIAE